MDAGRANAAQQGKRTGREPPEMATTNTTARSWQEWAGMLTKEQLAARLHMLADSLKYAKPDERSAILTAAADALGFPKSSNPKLGTAPKLQLGDAPAPAGPTTPAADTDQEAPAGRAPRRKRTGDPRADRKAATAA
jgi:hypothetical protein